jgi:NTE family protein
MASACLPFLFRAVEIDGEPYWDGGYVGNPPLLPFLRTQEADDIVLVQTNPLVREGTPHTAREILNRVNEITFNASLNSEIRSIELVNRLVGRGIARRWTSNGGFRPLRLHRITADAELNKLTSSSRMNIEWSFFRHLRDIGRRAADEFLRKDLAGIGRRSTLDLQKELA